MNILEQEILGNSLSQWGIAATALVVTVFILIIMQRIIGRRLTALAKLTETHWDDIFAGLITHTKLLFLLGRILSGKELLHC